MNIRLSAVRGIPIALAIVAVFALAPLVQAAGALFNLTPGQSGAITCSTVFSQISQVDARTIQLACATPTPTATPVPTATPNPALVWKVPAVTGIWQSTNYDPGTDYMWKLFNCYQWQATGTDDENTAAVFSFPQTTTIAGIRFKSFGSDGSPPPGAVQNYHSTLWLRETNPYVKTDPAFGNTPDRVLETALYRGDNDDPNNPGFISDGVQANRDFPAFGQATVTVTDPRTGVVSSAVQSGGVSGWQWDMRYQEWTPVQIVFSQPRVIQAGGHLRFENIDIGGFNVVGNYGVQILTQPGTPAAC